MGVIFDNCKLLNLPALQLQTLNFDEIKNPKLNVQLQVIGGMM